jgi:phosphonate transport system substrate-binding protein
MLKVIALFAAVLFSALPVAAETLTFSPLPMETPYTVASQWKPLLTYLEQALGVTLKIDYSTSNDEILDKFKAGRLDLAYLGPLPYVILRKSFPAAEPVVIFHEKNGQPAYTCALVVSADSTLNLKGLKERKIALTQPLSTCGYFATEGLLHQKDSSLEDNRFRYLGQHDDVALAVVRGEFDAGGLKTAIARKYAHLGLVVRGESLSMPGLALVANSNRVSAERIAQIRQVLLSVDHNIRQQWGDNIRHGVAPAKDSDYDGTRQLPVSAGIPAQGNF